MPALFLLLLIAIVRYRIPTARTRDDSMPPAHQYAVTPINPAAHIFEVSVTVARPERCGQAFAFPAWIPGSYVIRDLARHVVTVRAESYGLDVSTKKIDKSTWQLGNCDGPVTFTAEIYAFNLNVRGAYLDTNHAFFDGACLFPSVVGQEEVACELNISAPAGNLGANWRVATSMRAIGVGHYEFGRRAADCYADLIDHPVQIGNIRIGEFDVLDIPHAIAVYGEMRLDMARLCHDLAALCECQIKFFGKPADLDRYLFLLTVRESGYGGLEHRWSSSLMCSRKDLPKRDAVKVSDGYRSLLGLCSHEYFHLWNVKRMKPASFTPYRLQRETHTGLLWVFEGITSYYDDLFLLRSGLISCESYLELLGKVITRLQRTRGRFKQTIEESSFDAWTKLYKPNANSSNSMVSYYSKGSLVALALDLNIRHESDGAYSLDDVMLACWSKYGMLAEGMPERGFEDLARSVTGLEIADFFERYVRGLSELPLQGLFKSVGIELSVRASEGRKDEGGRPGKNQLAPPPWSGAQLSPKNGASVFSLIHAGGPAEIAGIAPGDEPVAIDGLRLTAANFDDRLRAYRAGDAITVTVFRDHNLMRRHLILEKAPEDACFLSIDSNADAKVIAEREKWLGLHCSD